MAFDIVSFAMGEAGIGAPLHGDTVSYLMGKAAGGGGGGGGSILLDRWDFTSETPLTGVNGGTATKSYVTFDSDGGHFGTSAYIYAPSVENYDVEQNDIIEFVIGFAELVFTGVNLTIATQGNTGLGLGRNTRGDWRFHADSSGWKGSGIATPENLNNRALKIRVNYDNVQSWKIYVDDDLVWDAPYTTDLRRIRIGVSASDTIVGAIVKYLEIYKVTEDAA